MNKHFYFLSSEVTYELPSQGPHSRPWPLSRQLNRPQYRTAVPISATTTICIPIRTVRLYPSESRLVLKIHTWQFQKFNNFIAWYYILKQPYFFRISKYKFIKYTFGGSKTILKRYALYVIGNIHNITQLYGMNIFQLVPFQVFY